MPGLCVHRCGGESRSFVAPASSVRDTAAARGAVRIPDGVARGTRLRKKPPRGFQFEVVRWRSLRPHRRRTSPPRPRASAGTGREARLVRPAAQLQRSVGSPPPSVSCFPLPPDGPLWARPKAAPPGGCGCFLTGGGGPDRPPRAARHPVSRPAEGYGRSLDSLRPHRRQAYRPDPAQASGLDGMPGLCVHRRGGEGRSCVAPASSVRDTASFVGRIPDGAARRRGQRSKP